MIEHSYSEDDNKKVETENIQKEIEDLQSSSQEFFPKEREEKIKNSEDNKEDQPKTYSYLVAITKGKVKVFFRALNEIEVMNNYKAMSIELCIGGKKFIIKPGEELVVDLHRDIPTINAFLEDEKRGQNLQNITQIKPYSEPEKKSVQESVQKFIHHADRDGKGPVEILKGLGSVRYERSDIVMHNQSMEETICFKIKNKKHILPPQTSQRRKYFSDLQTFSPDELHRITEISLHQKQKTSFRDTMATFAENIQKSVFRITE